jgi:hypothetical protein
MSTPTLYDSIRAALQARLPQVIESQRTNLALLVAAAAQTQSCHLANLARALPLRTQQQSKQQRIRPTLDNIRIQQRTQYRPIVQTALHGLRNQAVSVLIDRVILNDQFNVLAVSAAFRHRSVPLHWEVLEHEGASGADEQIAALQAGIAALPADVRVTVQGDGEFRSIDLFRWARQRGYHAILGLSSATYVYPDAAPATVGQPIAERYGDRRDVLYLHGVYLTHERLGPLNVVIWWDQDADGDRIRAVMTDLPATRRTFQRGKRRMWIETLFRDWQSSGFHLNSTGLLDADRLERLLIPLVIAYLLFLSIGRWVVKRGYRYLIEDGTPDAWHYSLFQLGIGWMEHLRGHNQQLPIILYLYC